MKCYFFHLMPYGKVAISDLDKHDTAWLTLPNSLYDPKEGAKLYHRYIGELELADELGFDGICVNEHHQTAYGIMPAPNLIAASLARTTKRAKICVLGRALPLVNNPVNIAEEFAMLDNLSDGRLIAGFVRGIGTEYYANASNPSLSHARYYEAHDLILRAWKERGPFRYTGRHYEFDYVNIWPRPVQQPHPPVWIPSQGSTETVDWCAHPDRKYTYLQTFSPIATAKKGFDRYREMARKSGYEASPSQMGWALPMVVADTDEKAHAQVREHAENFFNKFLHYPLEARLPPGYTSVAGTKALIEQKFKLRKNFQTYEALLDMGMIVAGSPKTVRETILKRQQELGFGHLICMLQIAGQPAEQTERSLRLFASEVMPHLHGAQVAA
jgi:alkanesulfonate monooxygenase SsuD/methylene tetrahydromethanopterin reductase-like flavin-dependent oxidoreductase (luciferase family)